MQARHHKSNSFISLGEGSFLKEHIHGTDQIGCQNVRHLLGRHQNLFRPFSPLSFYASFPCPHIPRPPPTPQTALQRGPLGVLNVSGSHFLPYIYTHWLPSGLCQQFWVLQFTVGSIEKSINTDKLLFRGSFEESFSFAVFIKFNGLFMALPIHS